jgi:hypothetical protein
VKKSSKHRLKTYQDLEAITKQVLEDGVKSFAKSFDSLLASIVEKGEETAVVMAATVGGIRTSPLIFRIKILICLAKR